MNSSIFSPAEVEGFRDRLREEAESGGYHLNPETADTLDLVRGLLVNIKRYGYPSCPCRLADGAREKDRDIICPCDYRDPDLDEYGTCYCALYVTRDVLEGRRPVNPIPERRPFDEVGAPPIAVSPEPAGLTAAPPPPSPSRLPVWRCKVCGYLCARPHPPETCPVCKADRDRFEPFPLSGGDAAWTPKPAPPDLLIGS